MPKYAVTYLATVSKTVVVEAGDKAEASDKADEIFDGPGICYQCSQHMDMSDWYPDEGQYGITLEPADESDSVGNSILRGNSGEDAPMMKCGHRADAVGHRGLVLIPICERCSGQTMAAYKIAEPDD